MGPSFCIIDLVEDVLVIELDIFATWDGVESSSARFLSRSNLFKQTFTAL
jgi:hypothetical protein